MKVLRWLLGVPLLIVCQIYLRGLNKVTLQGSLRRYPKPTIFYANHRSYADGLLTLGDLLFRIYGFKIFSDPPYAPAAEIHFRSPIRKFLLKIFHGLPVKEGNARSNALTLRALCEWIKEGKNVLIFPEGQVNNEFSGFKRGIGKLALINPNGVLVPIWIHNSEELSNACSSKPLKFLLGLKFFKTIRLTVGDPIPAGQFIGQDRETVAKILETKLLGLKTR